MLTTNPDDPAGAPHEGQKAVPIFEFRNHRTEDALGVEHMHFTSRAQEALCFWAGILDLISRVKCKRSST